MFKRKTTTQTVTTTYFGLLSPRILLILLARFFDEDEADDVEDFLSRLLALDDLDIPTASKDTSLHWSQNNN